MASHRAQCACPSYRRQAVRHCKGRRGKQGNSTQAPASAGKPQQGAPSCLPHPARLRRPAPPAMPPPAPAAAPAAAAGRAPAPGAGPSAPCAARAWPGSGRRPAPGLSVCAPRRCALTAAQQAACGAGRRTSLNTRSSFMFQSTTGSLRGGEVSGQTCSRFALWQHVERVVG